MSDQKSSSKLLPSLMGLQLLLLMLAIASILLKDTLSSVIQPYFPVMFAGLSVLILGAMGIANNMAQGKRQSATEDAERSQEAILRLLDELGSLADGDLTVEATVTEDITGAIADSINYAIEALRELVTTIDDTAEQ